MCDLSRSPRRGEPCSLDLVRSTFESALLLSFSVGCSFEFDLLRSGGVELSRGSVSLKIGLNFSRTRVGVEGAEESDEYDNLNGLGMIISSNCRESEELELELARLLGVELSAKLKLEKLPLCEL